MVNRLIEPKSGGRGGGGSAVRKKHCYLAGKRTSKGKTGHPKLANCKRNAKGPNKKTN